MLLKTREFFRGFRSSRFNFLGLPIWSSMMFIGITGTYSLSLKTDFKSKLNNLKMITLSLKCQKSKNLKKKSRPGRDPRPGWTFWVATEFSRDPTKKVSVATRICHDRGSVDRPRSTTHNTKIIRVNLLTWRWDKHAKCIQFEIGFHFTCNNFKFLGFRG